MFVIFLTLWIVGALCFIMAHAYFGWQLANPKNEADVLVFLATIWMLIIPVGAIIALYRGLEQAGQERRRAAEEQRKIRIAEEARAKKLLEESNEEVEKFIKEFQQKTL